MRITERQLRRIIREEILHEIRITPDNLPDDFTFILKVSSSRNFIVIKATKGSQEIGWLEAGRVMSCYGAFEVLSSNSYRKGLGPMLYDIAMEVATELGGGLISDRYTVSDDAQRVWGKFQNDRPDVVRSQLDSLENELTPTEVDNCDVEISKIFVGDKWPDHPLSGAYRKSGMETIRRLSRMKKIQIDGMDI
jgi:hypothetical protein